MLGDYVRDKDAVTAALLLTEMAAWYADQGKTLADALDGLYEKYGYYGEKTMNLVMPGLDGLADMARLMKRLREEPPAEIGGVKVAQRKDYADGSVCPFDLDQEVIDIPDDDFGVWYVDVMEHPERYEGKTVRAKVLVAHLPQYPGDVILGRFAMTCCEADMTFLGFVCKAREARHLETRQWVRVRARIEYEEWQDYGGVGPVLHALSVEPDTGIIEVVQF